MVLCGLSQEQEKCKHASYLFNEMSKFQKVGILCDVQVPGQLHVVDAHRIVLMSARPSSDGSSCSSLSSATDQVTNVDYPMEDVFVEQAYSSASSAEDSGDESDDNCAGPRRESLGERLGALNDLRLHHCCCDVTLVADEIRCDAHKVVLAACSDYFRAMFTSNMREAADRTVTLRGVGAGQLRRVVDFMYTAEVSLDFNDAVDLLKVALYYQIAPLINRCQAYLLEELNADNCCYLACLARDLALDDFALACCERVFQHFLELDADDSEVELLRGEDLLRCLADGRLGGDASGSSAERTILRVLLRWLCSNRSECDDDVELDRILTEVRFALIPADEILSCVREFATENNNNSEEEDDFIKAFGPVFKRHLGAALDYHRRVFEQPLLQTAKTQLRACKPQWACIDGVLAQNPVLLPSQSRRITVGIQDAPAPVQTTDNGDSCKQPIRDPYHNVVEHNGFLFALGSTRKANCSYTRTVVRYDPRLDCTTRLADMTVERGDFVACVLGAHIYVIGGRNRHGALRSCERYDIRNDVWEKMADLPQGLYMSSGASHGDDAIYVCGGFNDWETVNCTLRYSPSTDCWNDVQASMMCERGFHALVQGHDGRLWAVGGVDNPFSGRNVWEVEAFCPQDETWGFVGQVLPVQPFLSTMRLNAALRTTGVEENGDAAAPDRRCLCVFAVTGPHRLPMLEYVPAKRMWFEMRSRLALSEVDVD